MKTRRHLFYRLLLFFILLNGIPSCKEEPPQIMLDREFPFALRAELSALMLQEHDDYTMTETEKDAELLLFISFLPG